MLARSSASLAVEPLDDCGREVAWVNQFLDAQKLRQLSVRSLRADGFDLVRLRLGAVDETF
jgi:hypothetical protein